jgi:hypothetical protein
MKLGNLKRQAESYLNQYKTEAPATYAAAQQAIGGVLIVDGFIGIDNPLGGDKRSGIFGSLIGIAMGVVFIFVPSIFNSVSGTNKMTATTTATIVSVKQDTSTDTSSSGSSCSAKAKYTVGSRDYEQNSAFSSGNVCALTPGSSVMISYNPNNPGSWGYDLKSINNFMKVFSVGGIIFAIAGFITFIIRLLSIVFGWKLLKSGRALAKTLPEGTDLNTMKNEIKGNFAKTLFGFGGTNTHPTQSTVASVLPPQQPPQAVPPSTSIDNDKPSANNPS